MIGHGGGNDVKMLEKKIIIRTYLELILYKPVGKYQFTMACIRALVLIEYQVIKCLISQPKHVVGTQKNRRNETVLLNTKL